MTRCGLYIHIPFCSTKCPYCDFYSVTDRQDVLSGYGTLIGQELLLHLTSDWPFRTVDTIYFGGGTPSLLTPEAIAGMIKIVTAEMDVLDEVEISMEANPGTLTADKLAGYHEAGINRLSLGVQSFQMDLLRQLGRNHTLEDSVESIGLARASGFTNLSLDLIYNIPGQTQKQWIHDLEMVRALEPEHVSAYTLTVEGDTPLHRAVLQSIVTLPSESEDLQFFRLTHEKLPRMGLGSYEVSNFAREGYQCRHNLHYWRQEPYLGLGPSAHSFDGNMRWWNGRDLGNYQNQIHHQLLPVKGREKLTATQQFNERLLNGLRLSEGADLSALSQWLPSDFDQWLEGACARWSQIQICNNRLVISPEGMALTDSITADLFSS